MSKEALIELVNTLQREVSSLKGRLESIEKRNHKNDLRKKFLK
jgi:hypothetical protein